VVIVDGVSQGLGGALNCVGTEYYMKHVQKVQPSEAQIYQEFTFIPWMVKPIYGLMTDVIPILGYHRRPYFIFAGKFSSLLCSSCLFHCLFCGLLTVVNF
jgi:BT1 family protein